MTEFWSNYLFIGLIFTSIMAAIVVLRGYEPDMTSCAFSVILWPISAMVFVANLFWEDDDGTDRGA